MQKKAVGLLTIEVLKDISTAHSNIPLSWIPSWTYVCIESFIPFRGTPAP